MAQGGGAVQPRDSGHGEGHVSVRSYIIVALILGAITAIEFGIVYVESLRSVVKAVLFVLSAVKFGLVALYFMHLKFENKLLLRLFAAGLGLAAAITLALVAVLGMGR